MEQSQVQNTQSTGQEQSSQQQVDFLKVDVSAGNENLALNVMVVLLNLAQRRGVYTIEESAKAWECIRKFQKPVTTQQDATTTESSENVTMNVTENEQ